MFVLFLGLLLLSQVAHGSSCLPGSLPDCSVTERLSKKDPAVRLIRLHQGGRTLEDHTSDFLDIAYLTDFPDLNFYCHVLNKQLH